MAIDRTLVLLELENEIFDWFTDYTVTHDVLHASNSFQMHAPILRKERLVDLEARDLKPGAAFKLYVQSPKAKQPVLCMSGFVDDIEIQTTREGGSVLSVAGRDVLGDVVDADVKPSIAVEAVSLGQVARAILVGQFGFKSTQIHVDNDAARALATGKPEAGVSLSSAAPINIEEMKVAQAQPHAGETAMAFLKRHATRFGLLIWATPNGDVVFGRPNYSQKPLYEFRCLRGGNTNVKQISRHKSIRSMAGEVHVYGHSHGGDAFRSSIHAVASDEATRFAFGAARSEARILTVHDNNAKTTAQALQRAKYELSVRKQGADVIRLVVDDHCVDGAVIAPDTTASVVWDDGSANEVWYVAARTFTRSRSAGTQTRIDLVPLHSIALGEASG